MIRESILAILFALLPPCEFEDSNICKWDAARQGNMVGASFIALADSFIIYR